MSYAQMGNNLISYHLLSFIAREVEKQKVKSIITRNIRQSNGIVAREFYGP